MVKERHTRGDVLCKDDDDDDDKEEEEEDSKKIHHRMRNKICRCTVNLQVKSHVPKGTFNLLKRTSLKVIDADGVLMDVKSFGHQR